MINMKHITIIGIVCITSTITSYSMDEQAPILNAVYPKTSTQQNIIEAAEQKVVEKKQKKHAEQERIQKQYDDRERLRDLILAQNEFRRETHCTTITIREKDLIALVNHNDNYTNPNGKYYKYVETLKKASQKKPVEPDQVHAALQQLEQDSAKRQYREECWETFKCLTCPLWVPCSLLSGL